MKNIDKQVLNEILNSKSSYYLINKRTPEYRHIHTIPQTDEAIIVTFNIPRKFWDFDNIDDMKYKYVEEFLDIEINSSIHLGQIYSPFQYGLKFSDVNQVVLIEDIKVMDFVVKCYNENVTDFYKAKDILNEMINNKITK